MDHVRKDETSERPFPSLASVAGLGLRSLFCVEVTELSASAETYKVSRIRPFVGLQYGLSVREHADYRGSPGHRRHTGIWGESMSTQPGRTVETARRHLHDVLRMGTSDLRAPMLDTVESWNWAVRISVVGLFVLALAGIAYSMASVVVPVLLAWVVAMVLLPLVDSLERRGFSRALTSTVLVILLIASIVVIIGVMTVPLTYWVGRTSELGALLKERLHTLGNPLTFFDEIGNALSQATGENQSASAVNLSSSSIVTVILSVLTPLVSQSLIFVVALVFHLIYQRDIQSGMLLVFQNDSALAYLGITILEGQVITPTLIGHRLTINPFLVFLAIWTWMWGPVGAFLGVPILLCGMVALRRLSSTGSESAGP
jgi:predicted PurR-regulated permease PerM